MATVGDGMQVNQVKLNPDKIEVIGVSRWLDLVCIGTLITDRVQLPLVTLICGFGVLLDSLLHMDL